MKKEEAGLSRLGPLWLHLALSPLPVLPSSTTHLLLALISKGAATSYVAWRGWEA